MTFSKLFRVTDKRIKYLTVLVLLCLLHVLVGCSNADSAVSKADIVGTYRGRYRGGLETFEILENGSFSQTFQIGTNTAYTSIGKWRFETNVIVDGDYRSVFTNGVFQEKKVSDKKRSVKINRIIFEPFIIPKEPSRTNSDFKVQSGGGDWLRNPIRIELGPWPYLVGKFRGQGAVTK